MSAWDLKLERARRQGLVIRYQPTGDRNVAPEEASVDGLDPAAFMYFALNNRNISTIMNAAGEKWVLILGRFTKRRAILDRVAKELKHEQFVPIIFDFERPKQRDLIETVILLAGMSAFVIAELSDPRSVPLELQAIASNYGVPIFPIIEQGAERFGMFPGLRKFRWVYEPIKYKRKDPQDLIARLRKDVIGPAKEQKRRLAVMKRRFRKNIDDINHHGPSAHPVA